MEVAGPLGTPLGLACKVLCLISTPIHSVCVGDASSVSGSLDGQGQPTKIPLALGKSRLPPWSFPQRPQCLVPGCGPSPGSHPVSGGLALRCHHHVSGCSSAQRECRSENVIFLSVHIPGTGCWMGNPKERQCQRMLKLLHNCTHLTG